MAMPAMAAEGTEAKKTITINKVPEENHTFYAYQIFKGTSFEGDDQNILGQVGWGNGLSPAGQKELVRKLGLNETDDINDFEKIINALNAVRNTADGEDALQAIIKDIVSVEANLGESKESIANGGSTGSYSYKITDLDMGYYVVIDKPNDTINNDEDLKNAAYSSIIVRVVEDTTVDTKSSVPTSHKKVMDVNDTINDKTGWQDSADYDINDEVPFQLTGTVAANYDDYTAYKYVFHDTQSAGLSFNKDTVVVKIDGAAVEKGQGYEVKVPGEEAGCTFEIVFNDLKFYDGTAYGEGMKGNKPKVTSSSTITVEYTSTLTGDAKIGKDGNPNDVYLEYSNNPNGDGSGTGKTPTDRVIVFTYETDVDKIDGDNKALEGAGFTLYKHDPDNKDAITADSDLAKKYGLEGYVVVGEEVFGAGAEKNEFSFKGLDDGTYKLVETTVPDGYNKAEDVNFTIEATHSDNDEDPKLLTFKKTSEGLASASDTEEDDGTGDWTAYKKDGTPKEMGSGTLFGEVVNQKGATLPETGGIGTTIFYVVGSVLVLAAVILLVTKRRMKSE